MEVSGILLVVLTAGKKHFMCNFTPSENGVFADL